MWSMRYNDEFPMDEILRLTECTNCGNKGFCENADYCRMCGTSSYNVCDGKDIYDFIGEFDHHEGYCNKGNASFCEKCERPTAFFNAIFLKPYTDVKEQYVDQFLKENRFVF